MTIVSYKDIPNEYNFELQLLKSSFLLGNFYNPHTRKPFHPIFIQKIKNLRITSPFTFTVGDHPNNLWDTSFPTRLEKNIQLLEIDTCFNCQQKCTEEQVCRTVLFQKKKPVHIFFCSIDCFQNIEINIFTKINKNVNHRSKTN